MGNEDNLENRKLATFQMVLSPDEKSITYQESGLERFEAAMKDQFHYRSNVIAFYYMMDLQLSRFSKSLFYQPIKGNQQYSYTIVGDYAQIDGTDYMINMPETERVEDATIQIHVEQIEKIHKLFPNIRFYSYYVTQANETGWFNSFLGTSVPSISAQIKDLLPPYVTVGMLEYEDLNDYEHCHYASDHHWNHYGMRRGYEDIYSMMREELHLSPVRTPVYEWNYSEIYQFNYRGSFARTIGDLYTGVDEFAAFEYDLPKRDIYAIDPESFEEIPLKELGLYNEYVNGEINTKADHYIAYYGRGIPMEGDLVYGEGNAIYMIRNTNPETMHNLLIYGDSYNRGIRDNLASHFNTTLYFQRDILENYDKVYLDQLIEKYNIDVFLLAGNSSIWTTDQYVFEFSIDSEPEGGIK